MARIGHNLAAIVAAAALFGPTASGQLMDRILGTQTRTEDGDAAEQMEDVLGEYRGLKHAVGVIRFENEAGYRSEWDLGNNLALMLESALVDSGRFVVLDRQNIDAVMAEQDLQASGRAAAARNVAQTGQLRSARYLATGAVTEVEVRQAGSEGGVRIRGFQVGASGGTAQITTIINRGSDYGVSVGQTFVVSTEGETLIDPETGEILGQSAGRVIARIEATRVTDRVAYCKLVEGETPERGAVVKAR